MSNFEPSKEMLAVKGFISSLPYGAYVSYADIAEATAVPMDTRGKAYLRSACRSLGVEYRCDRGSGIEIESPENSMHIITSRVKRVSSSVKRANKSSTALFQAHAVNMSQEDRNRAAAVVSLLGATMAFSKGLEQVYKPQGKLNVIRPTLGEDPFKK